MRFGRASLAMAAIFAIAVLVAPALGVAQGVTWADDVFHSEDIEPPKRFDILIGVSLLEPSADDEIQPMPIDSLAQLFARRPSIISRNILQFDGQRLDVEQYRSTQIGIVSPLQPVAETFTAADADIDGHTLPQRVDPFQAEIALISSDNPPLIVEQTMSVTTYPPNYTLLAPLEGPQQFSMPAIGSFEMDALLGK